MKKLLHILLLSLLLIKPAYSLTIRHTHDQVLNSSSTVNFNIVSANAFIGDGSQLTGIMGGGGGVTGNGQAGQVTFWNSAASVTGDSNFTWDSVNSVLSVTGNIQFGSNVSATGLFSSIGGGDSNTVSGNGSVIGGGQQNLANMLSSTISGGVLNTASGIESTVGGGDSNTASGLDSVVAGGIGNMASSIAATVGGGQNNVAETGTHTTVGGGSSNTASGSQSVVAGGLFNTASGIRATVPGGLSNVASGNSSFAAGRRAIAATNGAFVWTDNTDADFISQETDTFIIRASNGIGLNTNHASTFDVQVSGNVGPQSNDTFSLGNDAFRWSELFVASGSIHVGAIGNDGTLSFNTDSNQFEFNKTASGNFTGDGLGNLKRTVIIRSEADFPAPITGPFGVTRIPLENNTTYQVDVPTLVLTTPFLLPSDNTLSALGVTIHSEVFTEIVYVGTESLIFGISVNSFFTENMVYISATGTAKWIDVTINPNNSLIQIFNSQIIGFADVGDIDGPTVMDFEGNRIVNYQKPLKLNGINAINLSRTAFINTPIGSSDGPAFVFTEFAAFIFVDRALVDFMLSGESLLAIDSGTFLVTGADLVGSSFPGQAGVSFFQPDLSGGISSYADLSTLLVGTANSFVDDGTGFAKVTHPTHNYFADLTVTQDGTTNYNGPNVITSIIDSNTYVLDAAFVATENGSFANTAVGTRITTLVTHNITNRRTTTIAGSTNYNGTVTILNPTVLDYDISTAFVADDATGNYLTQSLDQTNVKVNAQGNGALPDSKAVACISLQTPETITITTANVYEKVGGSSWTLDELEEFSASLNGTVTYTGISPVNIQVSATATVEKVGGGTDTIAMRIRKNSITIVGSQGQTENSTPTGVFSVALVDLVTNDTIDLSVANQSGVADVIVDIANIVIR